MPKSKVRKSPNGLPVTRRTIKPEYLVTWFEVNDDSYYTHLACHRVTHSIEETNNLFGEILERQNAVNPAPHLLSLPCPQIFIIGGAVREASDDEYDGLFGCKPQFVRGM